MLSLARGLRSSSIVPTLTSQHAFAALSRYTVFKSYSTGNPGEQDRTKFILMDMLKQPHHLINDKTIQKTRERIGFSATKSIFYGKIQWLLRQNHSVYFHDYIIRVQNASESIDFATTIDELQVIYNQLKERPSVKVYTGSGSYYIPNEILDFFIEGKMNPLIHNVLSFRCETNSLFALTRTDDRKQAEFEKIKYVFINIADFYIKESANPQTRSSALTHKKNVEAIHNEMDLVSLVTQSYPLKPWEDVRRAIVCLDTPFLARGRVVEQLFLILQNPCQAGLPLVFPEKLITDFIPVLRSMYEESIKDDDCGREPNMWSKDLERQYGTTNPTDNQIRQKIIADLYWRLEHSANYLEELDAMAERVRVHQQATIASLPDETPSLKF